MRFITTTEAGNTWLTPENAQKPADARIKSGKHIKYIKKCEEQINA